MFNKALKLKDLYMLYANIYIIRYNIDTIKHLTINDT